MAGWQIFARVLSVLFCTGWATVLDLQRWDALKEATEEGDGHTREAQALAATEEAGATDGPGATREPGATGLVAATREAGVTGAVGATEEAGAIGEAMVEMDFEVGEGTEATEVCGEGH